MKKIADLKDPLNISYCPKKTNKFTTGLYAKIRTKSIRSHFV